MFPAGRFEDVRKYTSGGLQAELLGGLGGGAPQEKGKLHFARECIKVLVQLLYSGLPRRPMGKAYFGHSMDLLFFPP